MLGLAASIVLARLPAWAASEKVLYAFTGKGRDGIYPASAVIFDSAGNLYGTTGYGGDSKACPYNPPGCGTVFELTPTSKGSWEEKVLVAFNGTGGQTPGASLIFDNAGNLYGTTYQGGTHGSGNVFELSRDAHGKWTETGLYDFNGSDGFGPSDPLVLDAMGNLYGTTRIGGNPNCLAGCGLVYKLTPSAHGAWTQTILHKFNGGEGATPVSMIFDAKGKLYSVTFDGGANPSHCNLQRGCGTAFTLTPERDGRWAYTSLFSFNGKDGKFPDSAVISDAAGNLYDTTIEGYGGRAYRDGANGNGNVFELSPGAGGKWTEKVLLKFDGADGGAAPAGSLILDEAGNLYGGANLGGTNGVGLVFKLVPGADGKWRETVVHDFDGSDGAGPSGALIFDSAGNLYGVTNQGGSSNGGVVFEVTP